MFSTVERADKLDNPNLSGRRSWSLVVVAISGRCLETLFTIYSFFLFIYNTKGSFNYLLNKQKKPYFHLRKIFFTQIVFPISFFSKNNPNRGITFFERTRLFLRMEKTDLKAQLG